MIKELLAHPLTRGLDIDAPLCTERRRTIIQNKSFLRQIYTEWYQTVSSLLPPVKGPVLELGSGSGFFRDYISNLVRSDIFKINGVDIAIDGHKLPFKDACLRAIVMVDVLHHLHRATDFFAEALRCVKPGGAIAMVEPWISPWSSIIYKYLHHEPYDPHSSVWELAVGGPLSQANLALPWIVFARDRKQFERQFPEWRIMQVTPHTPLCYLLSGGVSLRTLLPGCLFGTCRQIEKILSSWTYSIAMFATIVLVRAS